MADLDQELGNIGDAGRSAKAEIDNLNQSVQSLTSQLSSAAGFTNDLSSLLGESARQAKTLSNQAAQVANNASSTKELMREMAKAQSRQRSLEDKALQAQQKAITSSGQQKAIYTAMATQLSRAAAESGQMAGNFKRLAEINSELDKSVQTFKKLGKFIQKIPGLGQFGFIVEGIGEQLRLATLRGVDGFKKLDIVIKGLGKASLAVFAAQLFAVDQEITNLGKSLNLSKKEATALKNQFAGIALNSEDIAINSIRLAKANNELNKQLGTAVRFSGELLVTFSKLTEVAGLSVEAAGSLAFQAQRSGRSFRDIEESALETSYALQRTSGVALNNKEILEATGKVTGQVRANLSANPSLIAAAVTKAKLFGAELDDIVASSKALLQFESSIENELKAELITGKQLNLERARALSLAGDQEGLAAELAAQAGNFTEFSKLNVLQQQELAAAFGMSADRLADILFKQEAQGLNAQQLRAIGKNELADRLEQLSLQEKLNLASEKFMTVLGELATVAMPILEIFSSVLSAISESKVAMSALAGIMAALAASSIITAVATMFSLPPPLGIVAGMIGVAAMMASLSKAKAAANLAEGGIIPATPGGMPIIAGEAGRAEAIIPLNRLNQVQQQQPAPQPVIVEGNFSNFKTSNYNQMAYTQMRQMNDGVMV